MRALKAILISTTALSAGVLIGVPEPMNTAQRSFLRITPAFAQNPCAARNPCAPSANPCNPCAGSSAAFSKRCVVPRLQQAAANPCAPKSNPCAAKANPCAAKANPCGAKANPCAAKANPCAAKANPCAAKANPCAAKANPCAASNPCNPCNPCGAAEAAELQPNEAVAAYDCMLNEMLAAYAKSGHQVARNYIKWRRYSMHSYQSQTHGSRYVQNFANDTARAYGTFERAGRLPVGALLAKDSFLAAPDGKLSVGPLFLMEKMNTGFNPESGDWKYTMIMPDGSIFGETKGKNSAGMDFCAQCHATAAEHDHLFFLPAEYRVRR